MLQSSKLLLPLLWSISGPVLLGDYPYVPVRPSELLLACVLRVGCFLFWNARHYFSSRFGVKKRSLILMSFLCDLKPCNLPYHSPLTAHATLTFNTLFRGFLRRTIQAVPI